MQGFDAEMFETIMATAFRRLCQLRQQMFDPSLPQLQRLEAGVEHSWIIKTGAEFLLSQSKTDNDMNLSKNQQLKKLKNDNRKLREALAETGKPDPTEEKPETTKKPEIDLPDEPEIKEPIADNSIQDPTGMTVTEISDHVVDLNDPKVLTEMIKLEKAGKNRVTALEAMADRMEDLQ